MSASARVPNYKREKKKFRRRSAFDSDDNEFEYDAAAFELIHAERALKLEQDHEYEASLRADAQKAERARAELARIEEQTRLEFERIEILKRLEEERIKILKRLDDERIPADDGLIVRVRTPDGVLSRTFARDDRVEKCHAWVRTSSEALFVRAWSFATPTTSFATPMTSFATPTTSFATPTRVPNDATLGDVAGPTDRGVALCIVFDPPT